MDLDSLQKPHSVFISHISQIISVYKSLSDSEPESELVSLVTQMIALGSSEDSSDLELRRKGKLSLIFRKILSLRPEPELISLVYQLMSLVESMDDEHPVSKLIYLVDKLSGLLHSLHLKPDRELVPLTTQIIFLIRSMDLDLQPKTELKSRITQIMSLFSSLSKSEPESELVLCITQTMHLVISVDPDSEPTRESDLLALFKQLFLLKPEPEIISLFHQFRRVVYATDMITVPESALILLITRLASLLPSIYTEPDPALIPVISEIISSVMTLDLDSQPKSELKSRISHIISIYKSVMESEDQESEDQESEDEESVSEDQELEDEESESELRSLVSQIVDLFGTVREPEVISLFKQLFSLKPEPELISLVNQLISHIVSLKWEPENLITVSPQVQVKLVEGKFRVTGKIQREKEEKGTCNSENMDIYLAGDNTGYLRCTSCNGEDHEEYQKALIEVEHPHHPEHSLQLALLTTNSGTRECFCCYEDLKEIFYYCSDCDHAMNISCVVIPPTFVITRPGWRDMYLFPRRAFLTCNLCAIADSSSPIYLSPASDFVIHQKCLRLPSLMKISRHPHRISFTTSFDQEDLSCGVCQRNIDNEYGGYSCIKDDCLYAAHSRCATRKTLWDGKELKEQPEDLEEEKDKEVGPFVRISDGIIQHFTHEHHHLRLDVNTSRDYDENQQCQACVTPVYCGNFYSCMQCEFILHETCANLSRKMHHPVHPHLLSLVGGYGDAVDTKNSCSACPWLCTGFFYQCEVDGCDLNYKLHVQCATISEPLVHVSHKHPLFLTSAPGEERTCWDCKRDWIETFNCIECDYALCFGCATLPQKVRYKHDKHMLTLSYREETSTMTYWCEVCEKKLNPKERVYMCDEYCCVTLHVECLIGGDCYMKPDLSLRHFKGKIDLLHNNHHMDRPFCTFCKRRCPGKNVLQCFGSIYCSRDCICYGIKFGE